MTRKLGNRGSGFKAKVALAAFKGDKTLAQLAQEYSAHTTQISTWKQRLLEGASELFEDRRRKRVAEETPVEDLYEQIGRLKMELEWLKKNSLLSIADRRRIIDPAHAGLSVRRQCDLVGLSRSSWHYEAAPETAANLRLMELID